MSFNFGVVTLFFLHIHYFDEYGLLELCAFIVPRSFGASAYSGIRVMNSVHMHLSL